MKLINAKAREIRCQYLNSAGYLVEKFYNDIDILERFLLNNAKIRKFVHPKYIMKKDCYRANTVYLSIINLCDMLGIEYIEANDSPRGDAGYGWHIVAKGTIEFDKKQFIKQIEKVK